MRNDCDRSERLDGDFEPQGGVTDLSALAASAAPSPVRETDGASGRVDLGLLVRTLHASDPGDRAPEERRGPSLEPAGTPPIAMPVAANRIGSGRRTFASGAAVGGFVAAAIALTPLIANVAYAPQPITVTMLEPAPTRGRVEHATVPVPHPEAVIDGNGGAVAEQGLAGQGLADQGLADQGLGDDDPIAGLDPLDRIEPLDPLDAVGPAPGAATTPAASAEPRRARSADVPVVTAALAEPQTPTEAAAAPATVAAIEEPPSPEPGAPIEASTEDALALPAPAAAAEVGAPPAPPSEAAPVVALAPRESAREPASIEQLLEGATPRDTTPAPAPREADLPAIPSRDDVDRALEPVRGAVRACAQAAHGIASVRITVAGSSGRVTSAVVEGDLAGTPTGSCVARAVRGAEFHPFQRATFTVQYPFRI